jgi:integrase
MVFADELGEPLHPNTLAYRFNRRIERADVPRIRFHDLRHTSATLMLANGEHPKIVKERLGHSDVSMTLNRYSHVTMDMQKDAAARLDSMIEDSQ